MSALIKGGRIITAADDYVGDIYVENETISLIGEKLEVEANTVIDASGKYVFPGFIDPHTHVQSEHLGGMACDDFTATTISAAFGGTTSVIHFCFQKPGEGLLDVLAEWRGKLDAAKPVVDVGFHIAITDLDHGQFDELDRVVEEGVTSYKHFMAYPGHFMVDDRTLFLSMQKAARNGAVVMVHAENGWAIDILVKQALAEGKTEPKWHAVTRPPITEGEATSRAIQLAQIAGSPIYVVHVSCREAAEPIAQARRKGWNAFGETCTQYLFIDQTMLDQPDFQGAKYVFTPPPRPKEEHEVLWRALATDTLSVLASDSVPFKLEGTKTLGKDDFSKIPNGAPGMEERVLMLHNFGVRTGRLSLNRMVEIASTNAAKIFGLYPRKGTIAVGSDADIVIWDPGKRKLISAATHQSNVDYNLFEGTEVVGAPEVVLVRGKTIVQGDRLVGSPGDGEFLKRARFGERLTRSPVARPMSVA